MVDYSFLARTRPCKLCGRPILWFVDPDGERLPLDATASCYIVEEAPVMQRARAMSGNEPPRTEYAIRSMHAFVLHHFVCRGVWEAERRASSAVERAMEAIVPHMEKTPRVIGGRADGAPKLDQTLDGEIRDGLEK